MSRVLRVEKALCDRRNLCEKKFRLLKTYSFCDRKNVDPWVMCLCCCSFRKFESSHVANQSQPSSVADGQKPSGTDPVEKPTNHTEEQSMDLVE